MIKQEFVKDLCNLMDHVKKNLSALNVLKFHRDNFFERTSLNIILNVIDNVIMQTT